MAQGPLTAEEQNEILAHIQRVDPKGERICIDTGESGKDGWMIVLLQDGVTRACLHPRVFLDIIRETV